MQGFFANRMVAGRYRIETPIGRGAFATVFCARDVRLDTPVALKILHPVFSRGGEMGARFRREARATARIRHPNVVRVVDFGEDAEVGPYLAMELLEGETLAERLDRTNRLGQREALRLGAQLADGLAAAHAIGVVHRDIKPANVFLLPRRPPLARLLDFGVAAVVESDAPSLTRDGVLVGTPTYMSPEQARGERPTPSSDVYALGVLLFEMLTGRRPFEADSPVVVLSMHENDPPPSPAALRPDLHIPGPVEAVVLRCLAKDARGRHPDMSALRVALARAAESVERDRRPARQDGRRSLAAPALTAVCAATTVGRVAPVFRSAPRLPVREARPPVREARPPVRDRQRGVGARALRAWSGAAVAVLALAASLLLFGGLPDAVARREPVRAVARVPGPPPERTATVRTATVRTVRIETVPSGALVRTADRVIGETPLDLRLAEVPRVVTLVHRERRPYRLRLAPGASGTSAHTRVVVHLPPAEDGPCLAAAAPPRRGVEARQGGADLVACSVVVPGRAVVPGLPSPSPPELPMTRGVR